MNEAPLGSRESRARIECLWAIGRGSLVHPGLHGYDWHRHGIAEGPMQGALRCYVWWAMV